MITAQVVLINEEGLILGVSRKDDHSKMGLPGGKMDLEDNMDPMVTAIRECKEETGLDVYDLKLIFAIHKSGNMGYTYLAKYSGKIEHDEPHKVEWVPMEVLINGPFGRYNQMVSESLDSMGIKYIKEVDVTELYNEVLEYVMKTVRNGYSQPFNGIRINKNQQGYLLQLYMDTYEPDGDLDIDNNYSIGIDTIAKNTILVS